MLITQPLKSLNQPSINEHLNVNWEEYFSLAFVFSYRCLMTLQSGHFKTIFSIAFHIYFINIHVEKKANCHK